MMRIAPWLLSWCVGSLGLAQSGVEPGTGLHEPPVLTPTSERRPAPSTSPGSVDWKPATGTLVREGSFLRNRRGRLVRGEGSWMFIYDADTQGQSDPPMAVLPCRRLREMQQTAELRTGTVTFLVTGEVFAFEQKNYLLPTFFSVYTAEKAPPPAKPATPAASGPADPGVNELLREMTAGPRPAVAPRSTSTAGDPGSDTAAPLREGVTLLSRRGRLVRDGGMLSFVTDTGVNTQEQPLPPLALLPCLNLESMDHVARARGDRAVLQVSGRVFSYEGKNFLLPTFFLVETDREGNLTPAH